MGVTEALQKEDFDHEIHCVAEPQPKPSAQ
jgi:hypothetical protein